MDHMNNVSQDTSLNVTELMNKRNAQLNHVEQEADYHHGDYVPGKDGEVGGFLIDTEEEMRQKTEAPQIADIKKYIDNQNEQIARLRNGESPAAVMGQTDAGYTDNDIVTRSGVMDRVEIEKVRKAFEGYELSATGLAPAGSAAANEFKKKMEDLESGKVNLDDYKNVPKNPTPASHQRIQEPIETQHTQQIDNGPSIVQFNVDSNKAQTFISTLDKGDRQRVKRASTIVVNEIKTLNLPTTTRVINSMSEYKRIAPRSILTDTIDCVLPNSGYVATVKGCGALAMAVLVPELSGGVADMNKRFQFCYDNLVTTSIGKLSLQEFISHTSMQDLDTLLFNILRASEADEQIITLTCGASTCSKSYDVKYNVSELIDADKIGDDLAQQIEEIVKARDLIDNAKAKHNSSPVMVAKYIQVDYADKTVIIEMKAPDGTIAIERTSVLQEVAQQYSPFVVGLLMYIPRIYIQFKMEGETEAATYEVVDPYVIVDTIGELNDESVKAMANVISDMTGYDAVTYSFKGPYKCPHCGRVENRVPCDLGRLIFFRVEKAMQRGNIE